MCRRPSVNERDVSMTKLPTLLERDALVRIDCNVPMGVSPRGEGIEFLIRYVGRQSRDDANAGAANRSEPLEQ